MFFIRFRSYSFAKLKTVNFEPVIYLDVGLLAVRMEGGGTNCTNQIRVGGITVFTPMKDEYQIQFYKTLD